MNEQSENELLRDVIEFSDDDLVENRAGRLTAPQKNNLNRKILTNHTGLVIGVVLLALFFCLGAEYQSDCLFVFGLAGLLVICIVLYNRRLRGEIDQGVVACVDGPAQLVVSMGRARTLHVIVDNKNFKTSGKIYNSFREGQHYRLYYSPVTQALVSAEMIGLKSE